MNQYQLVFNGTLSDGQNLSEVKRNLASLFKTEEAKVEQLFNRLPVVFKKNVDYDSALKYQQALRKAGAICQVEETIQNIQPVVMEKASPPPMTSKAAALATEAEDGLLKEPATSADSQKEGIKGLGDILSGAVLIGIGLVAGGSIFTGDPTWLDYFFDGLGLFWIGRGIYKMVR